MPERFKFALRTRVGCYPGLYYPLRRLVKRARTQEVHAGTEIVIEGYPRSGNSVFVARFCAAQTRPVVVAHHLHVPAQVLAGVRRGLPVIVLIRPPREAVASRLALGMQARRREGRRIRLWSARELLRGYLRFYATIAPYADACVVATFDVAVSAPKRVVRSVNTRYETAFVLPQAEAPHPEGFHARPHPERERLKRRAYALIDTPRHTTLLARTQRLYAQLTATGV